MPDFINNNLFVYIRTLDDVVFQGEAKTVSSVNSNGPFDILPQHSNFITLIKKELTVIELSGEKKTILVDKGVMKVFQNQVYIYLGVEALQKEESFIKPATE